MSIRDSVSACVCVFVLDRVCVRSCVLACLCVCVYKHTNARTNGQFFSKQNRHEALKTWFHELVLDSHLASFLYTGTLTNEECFVASRS